MCVLRRPKLPGPAIDHADVWSRQLIVSNAISRPSRRMSSPLLIGLPWSISQIAAPLSKRHECVAAVLLILWLLCDDHLAYGILLHLLLRQKFSNSASQARSINQLFSRDDVISYLIYRAWYPKRMCVTHQCFVFRLSIRSMYRVNFIKVQFL